MKKNIFLFASAIATLLFAFSCTNYEIEETIDSNATVQTLTVNATLSGGSGEGIQSEITKDDVLRVLFYNASGAATGHPQTLLNTSGEGASATFSADNIAVPGDAATIKAYLENRNVSKINYISSPSKADYTEQGGTLKSAQGLQIISGTGSLGSTINLSYATSIIKVTASYPEGVTPDAANTTISLDINAIGEATIGDAITGKTATLTAPATVNGQTATAYFAVIASGLKDGNVFSNVGTTKYGTEFIVSGLKAAQTLNVTEEVETLVYNLVIPDEVYTISGVKGNLKSASDWISLSGGVITVAANKTGAIRKGSIALDNDKVYNFTQIGPGEFAGGWTFITKLFDPNKTLGKGNTNAYKAPVTIELAEGENGNNAVISGLYLDAKVEAKIVVDYETMEAKLGVYLSTSKIYDAGDGKYCVLLPECAGAGSYWANYNFCPKADKAYSDDNYDWLWFDLDEEYAKAKYQNYGAGQVSPNGVYKYCGLSFVKASATAITGSSYDVIYQANYNGSNAESQYFVR